MMVDELIGLGRIWWAQVYASCTMRTREEAMKVANQINASLNTASFDGIKLVPGRIRRNENWREPMIFLNGRAYSYDRLGRELAQCPKTWMLGFLAGERDADYIEAEALRFHSLLKLLAVIVCVAEVGRGMTRCPEQLQELLGEGMSWSVTFQKFTPALKFKEDDAHDWEG